MKDEEFRAQKERAYARNREIKARAEENAALKAKLAATNKAVTDLKGAAGYGSLPKEVRDKLEALEIGDTAGTVKAT